MSTEKSQLDKTNSSIAAANDVGEIITPKQLSMPAVPIQRVASGKTNTEELQSEKDQHSMNGVEERILASYSSVPPDDDGSNGQNKGNALQGKFHSPNPLQFKIPKSTLKSFSAPPLQFKNNTIQKQSEEEEPVQGKFNTIQKQSEEEEPAQAKSSNPNGLPGTVQAQMENALGADFSNVNIHTNSQSATDVGALAYTQGNDVHFAPGQYNPETNSGQELIGHELTHVVQQRQGRVQPTTQAKGFPVNDDKGLEAEADNYGRMAAQMKINPAATIQRSLFGDEQNQIETQTGFTVNNPTFDESRMRQELPNSRITGADDPRLTQAMLTLYQNPQGDALDDALRTIAEIRGLDQGTVVEQYQRAMSIREAGRQHANPGGKYNDSNDPSPDLNLEQHPDFTGSLSQLRFGSALGDVFGVDPVFGALISPTGGLVGPGNNSVSGPANNGVVLHGTVHDAAGYLLNAHGVGPGYNYLNRSWELDSTNPLAGQVSGVSYWGGGTLGGIGELGKLTGSVIGNLASDAWNGAKGLASDAWNGAKGVASDVWNGAKGVASDVWGGAKGVASDVWGGITGAASGVWNGAKGVASDVWGGITGAASDVWNGAKGVASDVWGGARGAARDVWGGITGAASDVWNGAKGVASDVWGGARGAARDVWGGITGAASDVWNGAKGVASDVWGGARGAARDVWGGITGAASDVWNGAKGVASDVWGGARGAARDISNAGRRLIKDSGIGQPLTAPGSIIDEQRRLFGFIPEATNKPFNDDNHPGWDMPFNPFIQGGFGFGGIPINQPTHIPRGIGSRPEGDGYSTPWGYSGFNPSADGSHPIGYSGGFGLGRLAAPGNVTTLGTADINLGGWADPDGGTRYGLSASAGAAKGSYDIPAIINSFFPGTVDKSNILNLDVGLGTASADASLNPDSGFSIGAQANLAEAAITAGTTGTGDNDKTARFGLSEGVGAALRGHWGDRDKDGLREYGFGFDFGPVSVDLKTEDPLRDIGLGLIPGAGPLLAQYLPGGNLTEGLANQFGLTTRNASLSDTWNLIQGGATNAWNGAKGLASDAWNGVQSGASAVKRGATNAWNGAKGLASDAWDSASNTASNAWNKVKSGAGSVINTVSSTASNAWDTAKSGASSVANAVSDTASNAWSGAKGMASDAWDTVSSWF